MKLMLLFIVLCVVASASVVRANNVSAVLISQVYYDPVNTETGGEALELYNPTDASIDISGVVIKTKSSAADATIPLGTFLAPKQYFLLADVGWNALRDDLLWPLADYEEAFTLTNADAGVALLSQGIVLDAVGWGGVNDTALFEGTSAKTVASGQVLRRLFVAETVMDTNDNFVDFTNDTPLFHNKNSTLPLAADQNALEMIINITNAQPLIFNVTMQDDDSLMQGVQVQPLPGETVYVNVSVLVSDANGVNDMAGVQGMFEGDAVSFVRRENVSSTTALYDAILALPYYLPQGEYAFTVSANDSYATSVANMSFMYLSLVAIDLDATRLLFANALPGALIELFGDTDMFTTQPTVRNLGNTPLDVGVYASLFTNGKDFLPLKSVSYSFDNFHTNTETLSENVQVTPTHILPSVNAFQALGFRVNVPTILAGGVYSGSVFVVGVEG